MSDCPVRYVDYGPLTYSNALLPPYPPPPPSPPKIPPPHPPPYTFVSCDYTCNKPTVTVCSDGGMNSFLVNLEGVMQFACDFGTQV